MLNGGKASLKGNIILGEVDAVTDKKLFDFKKMSIDNPCSLFCVSCSKINLKTVMPPLQGV